MQSLGAPRPGSKSPPAPLLQESRQAERPCGIWQPVALETGEGRRVSKELPCAGG